MFTTTIRNPNTFLYNTGPISSPTDANWNRPQTYSVTRVLGRGTAGQQRQVLGTGLSCPPANVGVHSTPDYPAIAAQAVHDLGGHVVFAGPRADAFHVDLGSIFDLGDLRPFQSAYNPAIPPILPNMPGVNGLRGLNVHTIAIQVPITELTRDHTRPTDVMSPTAVIGVYATASRTSAMVRNAKTGTYNGFGGSVQVSRLGNPLINEVINPMSVKDLWNTTDPADDQQFAQYVYHPELAELDRERAVPLGVPAPAPVRQRESAAQRPGRDPAHRDPTGRGAWVPELHRANAGRSAPAERGCAADGAGEPESDRTAGRRRRRVPERSPADRRHNCDRAAGDRRADDPAGRSELQAGRRGERAYR